MSWLVEPYTFRRTSVNWFGRTYEISFEETPIRTITGADREYVEELVSLLNTAWNVGYSSGANRIAGIVDETIAKYKNVGDLSDQEKKFLAQNWLEGLR